MRTFMIWTLILAAAATAYVLGAKAGRSRYREIVHASKAFWNDPAVQKARGRAAKSARKATEDLEKKAARAQKKALKALRS